MQTTDKRRSDNRLWHTTDNPVPAASAEVWREAFGNTHPVEIEIGPGTGIFVLSAAASRPDTNFFAIEKSSSRVRLVEAGVRKRQLGNVIVLFGDATCVVGTLVPTASIQAIHIYFPDPWWKRRHERRRIFTPEFVDSLARVLIPGGYVYLATDVEIVFDLMLESMRGCAQFTEEPHKPSPRMTITSFERKGLARGAIIRQSAFVKAKPASAP